MAELLFEIGLEELPARFIPPALDYLRRSFVKRMQAVSMSAESIEVNGTPRRLVLAAKGMPARQQDRDEQVLGPPTRIAIDADGNPTKAGIGFAKRQGVEPSQLERIETPKGEYVGLVKRVVGRSLIAILQRELPELLAEFPFPKSMRWGTSSIAFARPIHWLVAVVDGEVVRFDFADVSSSNETRGHRFTSPGPFTVSSYDDYRQKLADAQVLLSQDQRKELILSQARTLAEEAGGKLLQDPALLTTVANLTEDPHCVLGRFDSAFLELPDELLITSMKNHQKYFSVVDGEGRLMPCFVVAINTRVRDPRVVAQGNERVLSARLSDARFFWQTDLKRPLASHYEDLKGRIFLKGLGHVAAKVDRISRLAVKLGQAVGLEDTAALEQAARLCKCDLATEMVGEFPELQGVMGREYARKQDVAPEVADAIFEHYLPRGATDGLPPNDLGALVGIADRIDSIVGCFGLGMKVSGAQDPYALRRRVLGIMRIILDREYDLPLAELTREAIEGYLGSGVGTLKPAAEILQQTRLFARDRFKHLFAERYPTDVIDAVLSARFDRLNDALERIKALSELKTRPEFESLAVAWKRMVNITRKNPPTGSVDSSRLTTDAERDLHNESESVKADVAKALEQADYQTALQAMIRLKPVVDKFFDDVLVMDPDLDLRNNRLALLMSVQVIFSDIANFTKIQT